MTKYFIKVRLYIGGFEKIFFETSEGSGPIEAAISLLEDNRHIDETEVDESNLMIDESDYVLQCEGYITFSGDRFATGAERACHNLFTGNWKDFPEK